ncbi:hypothetical protein [Streptomyces sp. IMTB 2501]|nr:hypothetical protein [Streptomyces sp. IMTB 2501]
MLRGIRYGRRVVVGAITVLDAWRVRAALESAARRGQLGDDARA